MKRWIALTAMAMGAVVLRAFPPENYGFYPRCPVYTLFHVRCPGCGITRALAALLRGDVVSAWHWNALAVTALPVGLAYVALTYASRSRSGRADWPTISPWAIGGMVGLALIFGVVRNIAGSD